MVVKILSTDKSSVWCSFSKPTNWRSEWSTYTVASPHLEAVLFSELSASCNAAEQQQPVRGEQLGAVRAGRASVPLLQKHGLYINISHHTEQQQQRPSCNMFTVTRFSGTSCDPPCVGKITNMSNLVLWLMKVGCDSCEMCNLWNEFEITNSDRRKVFLFSFWHVVFLPHLFKKNDDHVILCFLCRDKHLEQWLETANHLLGKVFSTQYVQSEKYNHAEIQCRVLLMCTFHQSLYGA